MPNEYYFTAKFMNTIYLNTILIATFWKPSKTYEIWDMFIKYVPINSYTQLLNINNCGSPGLWTEM